ncbi:MAG: ABC transporter permease, partial [Candidatus Kapabacteria bacterium]|nr:ABC transporter permease [Candidatus Kapabacteria bacterium]
MKPALIRFIAQRFSAPVNTTRFLSYTRLIAFLSVMVGTMALVLSLAVLKGYQDTFNAVLSRYYSHIQIQPLSADAANRMLMPGFGNFPQFSDVRFTAQSLEHEALIRCKGNIEGAFLKAWSNDEILNRTGLISTSVFTCSSMKKEVVLGKRLAVNLSCTVGDSVVLVTQPSRTLNASPVVVKCRVAAVLNTGMAQFDETLCLTTVAVLQTLMDNYGSPLLELWTADGTDNERLALQIEESLGSGFYSRTIRQQERAANMFRWIEEQQVYIPIVLSLITIVAVFNIVTTLLISIVEKSRSYAILLTL